MWSDPTFAAGTPNWDLGTQDGLVRWHGYLAKTLDYLFDADPDTPRTDAPDDFRNKTVSQRFLILVAGIAYTYRTTGNQRGAAEVEPVTAARA